MSAPGYDLVVDDLLQDRAAFRLTRGDGVTFRIIDRDGTPVPGAVIRVGEHNAIPLALTDDRGEATVGLARGKGISYQIEAEDGSFARTLRVRRESDPSGGSQVVEVRLWPAFELQGRVVDAETGQPIELATLWIDEQLDRLTWAGAGGEFTLTTRADYMPAAIRIAAPGYVMKRAWLGAEHYVAADERKPLLIQLKPRKGVLPQR